mmetsp:Transcript_78674/g.157338  ORF Transcript_78674/g.157338 Transcript_78674/m.157338 type:complete len:326 (+) Transcript_78674:353-1330(+)
MNHIDMATHRPNRRHFAQFNLPFVKCVVLASFHLGNDKTGERRLTHGLRPLPEMRKSTARVLHNDRAQLNEHDHGHRDSHLEHRASRRVELPKKGRRDFVHPLQALDGGVSGRVVEPALPHDLKKVPRDGRDEAPPHLVRMLLAQDPQGVLGRGAPPSEAQLNPPVAPELDDGAENRRRRKQNNWRRLGARAAARAHGPGLLFPFQPREAVGLLGPNPFRLTVLVAPNHGLLHNSDPVARAQLVQDRQHDEAGRGEKVDVQGPLELSWAPRHWLRLVEEVFDVPPRVVSRLIGGTHYRCEKAVWLQATRYIRGNGLPAGWAAGCL